MYKYTVAYSHWYSANKKRAKAKVKKDNANDKVKTRSGKRLRKKSIHMRRVQRRDSRSCWVRHQEDEDSEDEDESDCDESDKKDEDEDESDCDDDESDELDLVPRRSSRQLTRVPTASSPSNKSGAPSSPVRTHVQMTLSSHPTAGAGLKTSNEGNQSNSNTPRVRPRLVGASHGASTSLCSRPIVRLTIIHIHPPYRYQGRPGLNMSIPTH